MTTDRSVVEHIARQIGATLLPDSERWVNRFEVRSSSSNRLYVIAQQRADGVWGCACPGWTHHRKCHHLTDVLRRLAKVAETMPACELLVSARTAFLILDQPKVKVTKTFAPAGRVVDLD